jgi:hypothetical protein
MTAFSWRRACRTWVLLCLTLGSGVVLAQLSVSSSGTASYAQDIGVPPGRAGMSPKLTLVYAGGGVNGPVGHGWSVQGLSSITRCGATLATDNRKAGVAYAPSDKLCLDGQRLIQTDAAGTPLAFPQSNDARGLAAGATTEYRTEKDSYARIRAYGYANGDTTGASGPAFFRVWTKSGQIYDYGDSPSKDANTRALIAAPGSSAAMAWTVARIADTFGNTMDFKYEQRDVAWGSGTVAGSPRAGHEWNLLEVQYSGNKVLFNYDTDASGNDLRTDRAETYHQNAKNVSVRRLKSITTYVNARDTATLGAGNGVAVRSTVLGYDNGPITGRSRVRKIQECAGGPSSTRCLPATTFTYGNGGNDAYISNAPFTGSPAVTLNMQNPTGSVGVLLGDYNGDGKTDFIRWADDPMQNELHLSNGDGSFTKVAATSAGGKFNITDQNLFKSDGCYTAMVGDYNGDGLPDILRFAGNSSNTVPAQLCPTPRNTTLYINNGDGSFQAPVVPSVGGQPLALKRASAVDQSRCALTGEFCGGVVHGWTAGANFYTLDVDGDGLLDLITAELPAQAPGGALAACTQGVCTHVYKGDGAGHFTEVASNLATQIVFDNPPSRYYTEIRGRIADIDGDGLLDLSGVWNGTGYFQGSGVTWRSSGDGNFVQAGAAARCVNPIDFNGDGRIDCLTPNTTTASNLLAVSNGTSTQQTVAGFNLVGTGQELTGTGTGIGIVVADVNGDGREDILRWENNSGLNALYLSNGDGSFSPSSTFNLGGTTPTSLQTNDGSTGFVIGDFTGRGNVEILRLQTAANGNSFNLLLVKADSAVPDQLASVTTGSGSTSTLYHVPLSNPVPNNSMSDAALGPRYQGDRGVPALAAGFPQVDLTLPNYVVATLVTDSGVGAQAVKTEYAYRGLKVDLKGRGLLGFRRVLRQSTGPDGSPLTVDTSYLQAYPYTGVAAHTETYRSTLAASSQATLLSSTQNIYCEQSAGEAAALAATPTAPCAATARLQRPYLRQATETGKDLAQIDLPQVVTTSAYNASGDPTSIVVVSTDSVSGIGPFTKATTNQYKADDTSCSDPQTCSWILGRLQRASVTSTVPNALAALATSAGTSPTATATSGGGALQGAVLTGSLSFGTATVGQTPTLSATLANSGAAALSLTVPVAASISGTDFRFVSTTCGASLPAGANCTVSVQFTPSAVASRSGTLSLATGAGNFTTTLSGTGNAPVVRIVPGWTNWGTVGAGSDSGDWLTVRNDSNVPVLITAHTAITGPSGVWAWQGTAGYCQPGSTVLSPGGTCQSFFGMGAAATPGAYTALDRLSYQAQGVSATTFTADQSYAFAIGGPASATTSLWFSNVAAGTTSATQSVTVTNGAGYPLDRVNVAITGANAANFAVASGCPATIAAGSSCTVQVSFTPSNVGAAYAASLAISGAYSRYNASGSENLYPTTQSLPAIGLSGNGSGSIATLTSAATLAVPPAWYGATGQTVTASYRNDGNAPMTLASPALAAPLSVAANNCSGIAPGSGCSIVVSAITNMPGINQSQSFTPTGATASPAPTTVTWSTYTAIPRWGSSALDFGEVPLGVSITRGITLFNDGNVAYNWAANSAMVNVPAGYAVNTSACSNVAPGGGSCNVQLVFTPPGAATYVGSGLNMSAASYSYSSFSVTGTGRTPPSIAASPASLTVTASGLVSASGTVSFTNNGQVPTTLSFATSGGSSVSPTTLACPASGSCGSVTVSTPAAYGSYNGTLTMNSSAGGTVTSVPLALAVVNPVSDTMPWTNGTVYSFCGGQFSNRTRSVSFTISGGSESVTFTPVTTAWHGITIAGWSNGGTLGPGTYNALITTFPVGPHDIPVTVSFGATGHSATATLHTYEKPQCP